MLELLVVLDEVEVSPGTVDEVVERVLDELWVVVEDELLVVLVLDEVVERVLDEL